MRVVTAMKAVLVAATLSLALAATFAPAAAAEQVPAPCEASGPSHVGFDCTIGPVHCAFFVWVDLNPPNPTWDCP